IQKEFIAGIAVPKMEWERVTEVPEDLRRRVEELGVARVTEALNLKEKSERSQAMAALREDVKLALAEEFPEQDRAIGTVLGELEKRVMRSQILDKGERADGRKTDEIRPITCEVGVLPRTHGSALFT